MELKELIYQKFNEIRIITTGIILGTIGLVIRIKMTGVFFLLFLGWNLILALVPFVLTLWLYKNPEVFAKRWSRYLISFIWLLFLPNAPYILTDFIHLHMSSGKWIFFDFLLVLCHALTGLLAGIYSMKTMMQFYLLFHSRKKVHLLNIFISFLCGFGVYLGRFIRLNSWDLFLQPLSALNKIFNSLAHPMAWVTTIVFGSILLVLLLGILKKDTQNRPMSTTSKKSN